MAEVKANPIVQGLSGGLGRDLMFRRLRDGRTILCVKPDFSRRVLSEGQFSHQERFNLAAACANWAAKAQPIYAEANIPWKRGIVLIGPPGNGKTHAVKALINALGQKCLYVKSFSAEHVDDHRNIRYVFE